MPYDKDFQTLNKMATKRKMTTSIAQGNFRKSHENVRLKYQTAAAQDFQVRKTLSRGVSGRPLNIAAPPVAPDTAFGRPNRPSTPIKAVVHSFYGNYAKI